MGMSLNLLKSWLHKELGCGGLQVLGWGRQRSSVTVRAAQPSETELKPPALLSLECRAGRRAGANLDLIRGPWPRGADNHRGTTGKPTCQAGTGCIRGTEFLQGDT